MTPKEFSARLRNAMWAAGVYSQVELSRRSGVHTSQISRYMRGREVPHAANAAKLADACGIPLQNLLGEGARAPAGSSPPHRPPQMPPDAASAAYVPVLSKTFGGNPLEIQDDQFPTGMADRYIPVVYNGDDPHMFALVVDGDSMLPEYRSGDFVVASPAAQLINSNACIARITDDHPRGGVIFKIFRRDGDRIVFTSINPSGPVIVADAHSVEWAYKVVGLTRMQP